MTSRARFLPINEPVYKRMLASFRDHPGQANKVAKETGVNYRTARRAWERGWPEHPWGPPISQVFLQEEAEARARLLEEEARIAREGEQLRADARKEAIEARVREGKILYAGRETTLAVLLFSMNTLVGLMRGGLVEHFLEGLRGTAAAPKDITPKQVMDVLKTLALVLQRGTVAARFLQEMQSKHLGNAGEHSGADESDLSLEDAINSMAELMPMLERARNIGLVTLDSSGHVAESEQ